MKLKAIILLTIAFSIAACNYEFRETPPADGNSNSTAANDKVENGKKDAADTNSSENKTTEKEEDDPEETGPLVISGTGETAVYPCRGREVEFDKDSTANVISFTGECKKLTVDGVSNKVSVEKVGEIIVRGISNKVTYTEGLDGKKPKINKSGTSTEVNSKEELEKKKADK